MPLGRAEDGCNHYSKRTIAYCVGLYHLGSPLVLQESAMFLPQHGSVNIWASQTSRHPIILHLLRCIHFVLAVHEVELCIQHVPGAQNIIADAISRNLAHNLQATTPLSTAPIPVPPSLWQMLVTVCPDWSSPHWSQLWREYLHTV